MRATLKLLLVALAAFSAVAIPQAVTRTGESQLKLPSVGGVRETNPAFVSAPPPVWHAVGNIEAAVDSAQQATRDSAYTLDLSTRCSPTAEYTGPGVVTFSDVSGSYPTGITRSTSTVSGTPTVVESQTKTIRCTLDATGPTADQAFAFTVITPADTTAPTVPSTLIITGTTATTATISFTASTDASGILRYNWYRCDTAGCGSPSLRFTTTNTISDVTPGASARYYSISATDNSVAQNESARSTEILVNLGGSGTCDSSLIHCDGFESGIPTSLYEPSCSGSTTCPGNANKWEQSSTHAREGTYSFHTKIIRGEGAASTTAVFRSEVRLKLSSDSITRDTRTWCGGSSHYIPTATQLLAAPMTVWQWHDTDFGSGNQPPLTLQAYSGGWRILRRSSAGETTHSLGTLTRNEWTDFRVAVKWDPTGTTGRLRVWKNEDADGSPTIDANNIKIGYADAGGKFHYNKTGDYTSSWKQGGNSDPDGTIHEGYHDAYRVMLSATCDASIIKPQGSRTSAP